MNLNGSKPDKDLLWAEIKIKVTDIFNRNNVTAKLYMGLTENVVFFNKFGEEGWKEELYRKLFDLIEDHAVRILQPGLEKNGEDLLKFYTKEWQQFKSSSKTVHGCFGYMNRNWILQEMGVGYRSIYPVYELCCLLWKYAFSKEKLKDRVVEAVMKFVEKERREENIDKEIISGVINSFEELGIDELRKRLDLPHPPSNAHMF